MKIVRISSKSELQAESGNDCGGFRPPKGHLDTQTFPECEGYETDRNIVKKTVERRRKRKKMASMNIQSKHSYPIVQENPNQSKGIWERWQSGAMSDRQFVGAIASLIHSGMTGISKDPSVRRGIFRAIETYKKSGDIAEAARSISAFLSAGKHVDESHFAGSDNWYKRAQKMDYPELRGDDPEIRRRWLHPPLKERIIQKFKEAHPNMYATMEEMWDWYRRNFTNLSGKPYDWEKHRQRDKERSRREYEERVRLHEEKMNPKP